MDRETLAFLQANGYDYTYAGGIIDAEGNYVESVDINGHYVESAIDKQGYEDFKREEQELIDRQAQERKELEEFKKDSLSIAISEAKMSAYREANIIKEHRIKEVGKFSIVLGLSLVVFLVIKRLIK